MNSSTRLPMQLIQVEAKQRRDFAHEKWYAGAEVDCFIKDQSPENARYVAEGWIAKNGWQVLTVREQREISEEDCDDPEGREYFQQALIDEEVFVYFCFEAEDDTVEAVPNTTPDI